MTDSNTILTGSICLTDIPRSQMKKVTCKDGKERVYLNISIVPRKQPQSFTNNGYTRTYTHFVSCSPKKEERVEGEKYIFGDLETRTFGLQAPVSSTPQAIQDAPGLSDNDLPF